MLQSTIHNQQKERKQEIYQFYLTHSAAETAKRYGISNWRVYHIAGEMKNN